MNKDVDYWKKFYKTFKVKTPSGFSKFCLPFFPTKNTIIEFGCGNGRDSYFFANKGFCVTSVDSASTIKPTDKVNFVKSDLMEYLKNQKNPSNQLVYTRCFLHSINDLEISKLLDWSSNLFFAEFRAKADVPLLYVNHYRNHIDENHLLSQIIKKGFDIVYYSKGRNVAKFKNENPLIVRLIAKRINK